MKKYSKIILKMLIIAGLAILLALPSSVLAQGPPEGKGPNGGGHETEAGNNLSFPVIWAEGIAKNLPGEAEMAPVLNGEWWYWWGTEGTDPNIVPMSCPPDPDDLTLCDDGIEGAATGESPGDGWVRAYLQKDEFNVWQAESFSMKDEVGDYIGEVNVDLIDWGDNLESVDWYTRSQVRVEVVLFEDSIVGDAEEHTWPKVEYEMRHVSGWGINEVHGLAATVEWESPEAIPGPGIQATVYSPYARLTIQKLLVLRDDPLLDDLVWVPAVGWTEPEEDPENPGEPYPHDLINESIFNEAVYEGGDGPGSYSAEINVKGRVIYGYTWNVRNLNEGADDYRITFSFDNFGPVALNTFFFDGVTKISVPTEEEELAAAAAEEEPVGGGGEAILVPAVFDEDGKLIGGNLTYMDIHIVERSGGGDGGGKPEGGGGGSPGGGGGGGGHRR